MVTRPRISVDTRTATGARVRMWLLQSGADPVEASDAVATELTKAPQHEGVTRADVAEVVHRLSGKGQTRAQRFDDHGSAERWPRGSY